MERADFACQVAVASQGHLIIESDVDLRGSRIPCLRERGSAFCSGCRLRAIRVLRLLGIQAFVLVPLIFIFMN